MQKFRACRFVVLTGMFLVVTAFIQWSLSTAKVQAQLDDEVYGLEPVPYEYDADLWLYLVYDPAIPEIPFGDNESLVSGSWLTGGDKFVIGGELGGFVLFTIHGLPDDEVVVRLPSGREERRKLKELLDPNSTFPLSFSIQIMPDGTILVTILVSEAQIEFHGSIVSLIRDGHVLDSDRVRLTRSSKKSGPPRPL